jgi:hypothetical protein
MGHRGIDPNQPGWARIDQPVGGRMKGVPAGESFAMCATAWLVGIAITLTIVLTATLLIAWTGLPLSKQRQ